MESFKEIIDTGKQAANGLCNYFQTAEAESVLFGTSCVGYKCQGTMMIANRNRVYCRILGQFTNIITETRFL